MDTWLPDGSRGASRAELANRLVIYDASNVMTPTYLALQARGYTVRCRRSPDGDEFWTAENDTTVLRADGPVALLGLAALVETRGPEWTADDAEIDAFLAAFSPDAMGSP